ncbi:MAG: hypothetical protein M3Q19_04980 [Pseudomonadota bacterium]|nr:hypothetical protein [Pseudomonadota bacterium]
MVRSAILAAILAISGGCGQEPAANNRADAAASDLSPISETVPPPDVSGPALTGNADVNEEVVAEGPIDLRSGQAAGQVLQSYAALLEQRRFAEARKLWTDGGSGSGLSRQGFAEAYSKYAEIHAEIGAPGPVEGAAGSAYVEIPLRLYGKLKSGAALNSSGTATLRRVNDVPGSTAEQRRWHIYRIHVQPPL